MRGLHPMLRLPGRSCRGLLLADNYLATRISVPHPLAGRIRGLPLLVTCCCHTAIATSAAVGCVPGRSSPTERNVLTGTSVSCQVKKTPSVWGKLARALKRLKRALELLLRALGISLLFSAPIVSGSVVYFLHRSPGFPSAQLCDWWWRMLLRAIDRSGTTFIKVKFSLAVVVFANMKTAKTQYCENIECPRRRRLTIRANPFHCPSISQAAQWASSRQDTFPTDVCCRLAQLHTFTRRRSVTQGEEALTRAFGPSWRQFFALEDSLGSGCVACVYKGRFFAGENAGREIAVKILHPDIERGVRLDLDILRAVALAAEMAPLLHLKWLSLSEMVEQFSQMLLQQLDLRTEARNLEKFRQGFCDDDTVVFPRPIHPWVAGNALVEEHLAAEPISNFFGRPISKELASMGLQAFLKMVFITNFVHGDLHPGNLLVSPEGKLAIVDAGIVCELNEEDQLNLIDLFFAVVTGDGNLAGQLMIERARQEHQCIDPDGFCEGVDELVQKARSRGLRLGQIQAGELLSTMFRLCVKHEVRWFSTC